jgi:DNA-directed RNA polymerase subunit RPC12/RpoP
MIAGETPDTDGTYRCQKCGNIVRVNRGEAVPKCPKCAHDLYDRVE